MKGGESAYKWEGARHYHLVPVLDPEAAFAGRKPEGEVGGGDVLARRNCRFSHRTIVPNAGDNGGN